MDWSTFWTAYALFCAPWALLCGAELARRGIVWWRDRPVRKAERIIGADLTDWQRDFLRRALDAGAVGSLPARPRGSTAGSKR